MAVAIVAAQLSAVSALAQEPTPAQQACSPTNTPELPSSTLPIELLDYLERTAASPFVESFLLAHMVEGGNLDHWLGRCAKAFLDTPVDSLAKLRQRRIPVDQIIEVLRSAEEARLADVRLRESSTAITILEVLERLRTSTDAASLAANEPYLSAALARCERTTPVCELLKSVSARVNTLRAAYEQHRASLIELDRAVAGHASARTDSLRLATELARVKTRKDTVDTQLDELRRRVPQQDSIPQADSSETLENEQKELQARGDVLARELVQQVENISQATSRKPDQENTAAQTQAAVEAASRALHPTMATLRDQLRDGDDLAARAIPLIDRIEVRLNSVISSPAPLVASGEIRSAQSPNVLLELTDFIIARAKQELVIGYLVQLYAMGVQNPSVQAAFPETFRLMRGLSEGQQRRLSATAAGRVPLNVWRATISEDYRHIPISLARHLCGVGTVCEQQLASAEPALLAAERLVDGEPVFAVLRDLPTDVRTQGSGWEPMLREGVARGLNIAATLADALRVQGIAPTADPLRHPYILSGRALSQLSARQKDAFLRVLLINALPANVGSVTVDPPALLAAAERATRAAEALAAPSADSGGSAQRLISSATNAFGSGLELARSLLPADQQPKLKDIETRWAAVFEVLEPLARGDYSLVMPRTLSLVRTLGGDQVSAPTRVSKTDSADVAPNTSFRQVLAPGAHLSLGLGRTPLALLVGAQLVPGIRDVTNSDGTTRDANALRAGVAIAADVTLFRF